METLFTADMVSLEDNYARALQRNTQQMDVVPKKKLSQKVK